MNNDLISRSALKEEIIKCMTSWDKHSDYALGRLRSYEWAINLIDNAPTVEPTFGLFKDMLCSECDKRPQGEYTEEDMKRTIKENFDIGYEMAKNKYERPQGEWIHLHAIGDYKCSICGAENLYKYANEHERWIKTNSNFCPNCGADMRGDTK